MQQLVLAAIHDVSARLQAGDGGASHLPAPLEAYAQTHGEKAFLEEVLAVMQGLSRRSVAVNDLTKAIADTLITVAGPFMETGDAATLGGEASFFRRHLEDLRKETTPHYGHARLQEFISRVYPDASATVLQTPTPLSPEQRATMRASLAQTYPQAYPTFSVDRQLLGGMRLFIQGKLVDRSWQHTVRHLLSALSTS